MALLAEAKEAMHLTNEMPLNHASYQTDLTEPPLTVTESCKYNRIELFPIDVGHRILTVWFYHWNVASISCTSTAQTVLGNPAASNSNWDLCRACPLVHFCVFLCYGQFDVLS